MSPRTVGARGKPKPPDFIAQLTALGYSIRDKHEADHRRCDIGNCRNWSVWTVYARGETWELCSGHYHEYDRRKPELTLEKVGKR